MPQGKVHDQVVLLSLIPTFAVGYLASKDIGISSTLTLSTLVSALLLSPDLDTKSSNYYRWGVLRFIWIPYRKLIPHRSKLSHSFLLAPTLKIIYLSLIVTLSISILNLIIQADISKTLLNMANSFYYLYTNYLLYIYAGVIGILWANMQHILLDILTSKYLKHINKC